jgi:hypothetical protein
MYGDKSDNHVNNKAMKWRIIMIKVYTVWYVLCDQGLPILSEGACECLHHTKALEGSRESKGDITCTVNLFIAYVTEVNKIDFSSLCH